MLEKYYRCRRTIEYLRIGPLRDHVDSFIKSLRERGYPDEGIQKRLIVVNTERMIFTVLGAVAELERNLIQERIHMGLQRARKQGKQLGRRRVIVDRRRFGNFTGPAAASERSPR